MNDNIKIIQDISMLYELSLSTGESFDINKNCEKFIRVLMARKNLSFASVWIFGKFIDHKVTDEIVQVYAAPAFKVKETKLPSSNKIIEQLQLKRFFFTDSSKSDYNEFIHEKDLEIGTVAFFKLGTLGYLKFCSNKEAAFSNIELGQLISVMEKFAMQLESSLAHERLEQEIISRKNTEKALDHSEQRYKLVIDALSEGLIITDLTGRITFVNSVISSFTGYSEEELVGSVAREILVDKEERHKIAAQIPDREMGNSNSYEVWHKKKDGTPWLGRINASPYRDESGKIIGTIGIILDVTKKREIEKEISDSRKKYEDLFQNMYDAIVVIDEKGGIREVNKAGAQLLDVEIDQASSIKLGNLVHPDSVENSKKYLAKLLEDGFYTGYEGKILTPKGNIKHVEVSSTAIFNEKNEIIGSRDVVRDVTEEKKIKAKLAKRDARFRAIYENSAVGIIFCDAKGTLIAVNAAFEEFLGISKKDLVKKPVRKLICDECLEHHSPSLLEFINSGNESLTIETRFITKDGSLKWGRTNISCVRHSNGEVDYFIGLIEDVSKIKAAERKLEESRFKLSQVIDSSLDALIMINKKGIITDWNKQAEKTFGFTKEEAVDQLMSKLIIPNKYKKAHDQGMDNYLHSGHGPVLNNRIEITGLNKKGEEFPVELSISPISIDGEPFFSGFVRDITDRKRAENELIQAKQLAEQARLAERQFLANMSHEIRTPMNAVIGMTHLLYETEPDAVQRDYLDSLQFSADNLLSIINNILDLSKIEAGELEFEHRPFNLFDQIHGIQQTFQYKLRDKPVSVVMDIDARISNLIVGDQTRLNQMLSNLMGNAGKFTNSGTIGVTANLVEDPTEAYHIEFAVHDTGIGIPKDKIDTIFQNFKQAEIHTTRQFGGTGLGLAIVKQLVELQGGTITVESEEGKGSVFRIRLMFGNSEMKAKEIIKIKEKISTDIDKVNFKKLNILVVEDNPMNQKLITKIMDLWGCRYTVANDGIEGFEAAQEDKYDIVLMDIHMPRLDGCECAQQIRATKGPNQNAPIIALTAAALLDEKKRVFDSGMNEFLTKPFSPKVLKSMIYKLLNIEVEAPKELEKETADQVKQREASVIVDLEYLFNFSGGDHGFIRDMVQMFLDQTPNSLNDLMDSFENKDWTQVYAISHRMKPNFMMMGMKTEEGISATIEKMVKEERLENDTIRRHITQLKESAMEAYPILIRKLEDYQ